MRMLKRIGIGIGLGFAALIVLAIVLGVLFGEKDDRDSEIPQATVEPTPTAPAASPTLTPSPTVAPTPKTSLTASDLPVLARETEAMVIDLIKESELVVLDAAVTQKGDQFSLVVIVINGTTKEAAKNIGDNFLRMVKSLGPDENPGRQIGPGIFDYFVGVYHRDESELVLGFKSKRAENIDW